MTARIIDGKAFAATLRDTMRLEIARLFLNAPQPLRPPALAVILVGNNPASEVYVGSKAKQTVEIGMRSIKDVLPETTTEAELLTRIADLNADPDVDGILVQLPLPAHINAQKIIEAIDPDKDVDGFHPVNVGRLMVGMEGFVPCTPLGSLMLLQSIQSDLSGAHAVMVGRSNIVGKPMAQLLLAQNCTVTIAHSKTRNLPEICRTADILVAAVGIPQMIRGDWIKKGALVIDVGINRIPAGSIAGEAPKTRLVGDVAFDEALEHAGAITPVPGGVGPMTIACLLHNTLTSAKRRFKLDICT
jgi:methylenetetrahydrofolate dehydrogenase (NADP+) / methenyltetrahydrofolate cyclohydrolase